MGILFLLLVLISGFAYGQSGFGEALYARRQAYLQALPKTESKTHFLQLYYDYPREMDWFLQEIDMGAWLKSTNNELVLKAIRKLAVELGEKLDNRLSIMEKKVGAGESPELINLLCELAGRRRVRRLSKVSQLSHDIIFIRRSPVTPSFFAYTEGLSDAQSERFFNPGSELVRLRVGIDGNVSETVLLRDAGGMMRDPDVHFNGKKVLFSWKKSDRQDDYHLYEYDFASKGVRQLTFGLGAADFEGIYVNEHEIVFNSSRCVQTVDCFWTEVSNLYACNDRGEYIRRLGFDQVHTVYPQLMNDGAVIYTRWDYNDRGQTFTQSLFRMNPDGTAQTELYGNNSWFPTTPCHARPIPGTGKFLAVAMGHHTWQAGKLILIDPGKGRQEAEGVEMLAPRRPAQAVRIDAYGQSGELFRHPYPLDETNYIVAYIPAFLNFARGKTNFGLYYIDADGNRELLSLSSWKSANHPVLVKERPLPHERPSLVDHRKTEGMFYLHDIYFGPGMQGVARGEVKELRVVALDFRAAGIRDNTSSGPGGASNNSTPVSINNASWDVKQVLGTTPVHADGSACFTVPAKMPVYFQALDKDGQAIQTMRSWSTLQPGETFSCIGCHESKNEIASFPKQRSIAATLGPQPLKPAKPEQRKGFSYLKEIQPIWDKHCIKCHVADKNRSDIVPTASFCCPSDNPYAMIDKKLPTHSDDHSIPRFTWHNKHNSNEWVQQTFTKPRKIGITRVYWFDDEPRKGFCRPPESWKLSYQETKDGPWHPVETNDEYSVENNKFIVVSFKPVTAIAFRIDARMRPKNSSGILEWTLAETAEEFTAKPKEAQEKGTPMDLTSFPIKYVRHGREWAASYISLSNDGKINPIVNWISSQSVPTMLPPRSGGSTTSKLVKMLRNGHKGTKLSDEELRTVMMWIDLLIPYCGDYREANIWNEREMQKYDHYERKRFRFQALERAHLEAFIKQQSGEDFRFPVQYSNLAVNPYAITNPESFPRATSNSECRGEKAFRAANVIDGRTENKGHGDAYPSWGPEQIDNPWLKIDFGGQVTIDTIDIWLRADFPHDKTWTSAEIQFSDGTSLPITLTETANRQSFPFPKRTVTSFTITNFKPTEPKAWRAISEVEAWGTR